MFLRYNLCVHFRSLFVGCVRVAIAGVLSTTLFTTLFAQEPPPASGARILLLPRHVISGEHATLAVLDVNGRLTPGVQVNFSNGDHFTTDLTGRALFVGPLNPGMLSATIAGRPGRVYTKVLTPAEAALPADSVFSAPRLATIGDRFELSGSGFCGDADANQVTIAGSRALVLASSPSSLTVLPPPDLQPGHASVDITCARQSAPPIEITFVTLDLEADTAPLAPGEHRKLTVRVRGTRGRISVEARDLAPDIAELVGGNPTRMISTGGAENLAQFELTGRQRGTFLISIRLVSAQVPRPQPAAATAH